MPFADPHEKATFIVENLHFSNDLSVTKDEVRNAYQDWIGEPRNKFKARVIGDLYESITSMGATLEENKVFRGVGMRT